MTFAPTTDGGALNRYFTQTGEIERITRKLRGLGVADALPLLHRLKLVQTARGITFGQLSAETQRTLLPR